jgi:NhaP-type Na+/H+ or K+/H+ antiporter
MDLSFGEALLLVGALLVIAAALSGVMHGTVLSISVLSVALGIGLASADVVSIEPQEATVVELVELALVLTLFSDGLFVERELLRMHWGPVARAIVVAMPVTMVLLALAAKLLFSGLSWAEAFLLGAALSPTDPVVTSAVVTARRVPSIVRHTLNLESGLNDGLALPFVLFFLVLSQPGGDAGGEAVKLLGEALAGAGIGLALGWAGGRLHHRVPGGGITSRYEGIFAVGLGLAAFGAADVTIGNGLVAAFVAGIALGVTRHEIPDAFTEFSENVSAIFQVLTFFVFGALIVSTGYDDPIWPLLLFIPFTLLIARPAAIFISFIRLRLPRPHRLFIAWFGPKGVASMLFALFILNSQAPDRSQVFDIAAFVILASIAAHGLTDTLGSRWIERRMSAASQSGASSSPRGTPSPSGRPSA